MAKFVVDNNCTKDNPVRTHEIIVSGITYSYEFHYDVAVKMADAHATVFDAADDAFVVTP
jgi:hypothetical protein